MATIKLENESINYPIELVDSLLDNSSCTCTIKGRTIQFGGIIPWYPGDYNLNRVAGNRIGVRITPNNDPRKVKVKVIIGTRHYDKSIFLDHGGPDPYLVYFPLIKSPGETFRITIIWSDGKLREDFTIKVLDDAILESPPCNCNHYNK